VTAVAFGRDLVAATDEDGALVVWNATTGRATRTISQGAKRPRSPFETVFRNVWFSLDGASLYLIHEGLTNVVSQCWVETDRHLYVGIQGVNGPIPRDWGMPFYALTADREYWLRVEGGKTLILSRNDFGTDPEPGWRFSLGVEGAGFAHKDTITHVAADTRAAIVTVAGVVENPSPIVWGKGATKSLNPTLRLWAQGRAEPLWETDLGRIGVTGAFVAPGGNRVAVTGDAGQVWVFDARSGGLVTQARAGTGAIRSAAFGPGGKLFVVGCDDATARVLDAETCTERAVLRGHTEAVTAIAWSPNGEQIVTGSRDKTVRVWEYRR
jgi:WD40 repeat protein